MKRLGLVVLIISFLATLQAKAIITTSPGTPPDSSLVTLITTSGDTLFVKIIKIDLDYYYVLPDMSERIIKLHKSQIKQLVYPDGLVLNVAQSYYKEHPGFQREKKSNILPLVNLSTLLISHVLYLFYPGSVLLAVLVAIEDVFLPYSFIELSQTLKNGILDLDLFVDNYGVFLGMGLGASFIDIALMLF